MFGMTDLEYQFAFGFLYIFIFLCLYNICYYFFLAKIEVTEQGVYVGFYNPSSERKFVPWDDIQRVMQTRLMTPKYGILVLKNKHYFQRYIVFTVYGKPKHGILPLPSTDLLAVQDEEIIKFIKRKLNQK